MTLSKYEINRRSREQIVRKASEHDAESDRRAFVHDVDVVFHDSDWTAVNVFAIVVGDTAYVVKAGQVVLTVSRREYVLGVHDGSTHRKHDLFEHLRLFG